MTNTLVGSKTERFKKKLGILQISVSAGTTTLWFSSGKMIPKLEILEFSDS